MFLRVEPVVLRLTHRGAENRGGGSIALICWAAPSRDPRVEFQGLFAGPNATRRSAAKKLRMVLDPIIEPIVLRFEPDQDTGGSAVPSDDDFLASC